MAEETAPEEEVEVVADEEKKKKPARKSDMLIVIVIGFLVMILTPLISYFVVKSTAPAPIEKEELAIKKGMEIILDMRAVNVNIAQTKGTRFIRLEPHLVLSEGRLKEELATAMSMLTDRVILAASRRTIDELEGPQGKEALKRDIMSEINASIKGRMSGAVIDIYFSEYLIQ